MPKNSQMSCEKSNWQQRECWVLTNGLIRLTTLTGGGHIAEVRFAENSGNPTLSPLWVPPWKTMDAHEYDSSLHAREYGPLAEGKLLSGIVGHNLCLDYFGSPSAEEAKSGLSQHGEAPSSKWRVLSHRCNSSLASVQLGIRLPVAGIEFKREIMLRINEPLVYFTETVTNLRKADHFFHWTEHVSLGPPFLDANDTRIALPGSRALTYPHGYDENKVMLASNRSFMWPTAPSSTRGKIDLSHPLSRPGCGFVVGVLLNPRRETGFIAAINRRERLAFGYCFRRADFPWVTIWEENRAIQAAPWKRRTQALGMEFGTTPMPVPRRENFMKGGPLFRTPTVAFVPALGKREIRYFSFLAPVPKQFTFLREVKVTQGTVYLIGPGRRDILKLK